MKLSRKQIKLISFFGFYYFFIPFIFVNCAGADQAYIAEDTDEEKLELDACDQNEFLSQACAEHLAEQEAAAEPEAPSAEEGEEESEDPPAEEAPPADTEGDEGGRQLPTFNPTRSFNPISPDRIRIDPDVYRSRDFDF